MSSDLNLDKIVNAVKLGVAEAGGVPVVFPAIAVCDGIAMGHIGMKYSLVTRDLIADSTECMALAHQFDALVMVSFRLAEDNIPIEPVTILASSDKISPNIFSVKMTSNCFGSLTSCIAQLSTSMCS